MIGNTPNAGLKTMKNDIDKINTTVDAMLVSDKDVLERVTKLEKQLDELINVIKNLIEG